MVRSLWTKLRASKYRDVPSVMLGLFIGYNSDVASSVKGMSMHPTLNPGDYIVFVPYSLLRLWGSFGRPMVHEGDVVVVKISNQLSVCKRVTRITEDKEEADEWGKEHFTDVEATYFSVESASPAALGDDFGQEDTAWYEQLSRSVRSGDWDQCIDRVTQPKAWMWLEGDNPDNSFDSRACGAVPVECLRGRVFAAVWPRIRKV